MTMLKMPGPHGVITIGTSFQRAYECGVECFEHASAIVTSEEPAESIKEVLIDPSSSKDKVVHIGTMLSSK